MKYLIMCKSLTNAQRASLLLERRGLSAAVVKAPQNLRANGCGYALSLYRRMPEAVEILKNGQRVPLKEFFSPALYYGDYGRMNGYFVRKYCIRKPEWKEITDFHMDEVKLADMEKICEGLDWLFAHCSPDDDPELKVFDLKQFDDFIRRSADEFAQLCLRKSR